MMITDNVDCVSTNSFFCKQWHLYVVISGRSICLALIHLQQNGLRRLIEIIRWPQVSTRAGNNREVLSFQRGILPILRVRVFLFLGLLSVHFSQYLSSDFVVKSTLVTRVK